MAEVHLLVRSPFRGHAAGDRITDQKEVKKILAGPHAHHVMQTPAVHQVTDTPEAPTATADPTKGRAESRAKE